MVDQHRELLRVFLHEAVDWLDDLEQILLDMEERPGARELVERFMRTAHTLKGSAGIVRLVDTADLVHAMESVAEQLREGRVPASHAVFDQLAVGLEHLRASADAAGRGEPESPRLAALTAEINTWLRALTGAGDATEAPALSQGFELGEYDEIRVRVLAKEGKALYAVAANVPADGDPAVWAQALMRAVKGVGTVVATTPPVGELESLAAGATFAVLTGTALDLGGLRKAAAAWPGVTRIEPYGVAASAAPDAGGAVASLVADPRVRIDLHVLGELLRLVGELMIARDRCAQLAGAIGRDLGDGALATDVDASASQLGHLTAEMQDAIMRARMVPISRILRGLKRRARKIGREHGVRVALQSGGEKTELDKNLVDSMAAPLEEFVAAVIEVAAAAGHTELALFVDSQRKWNRIALTLSLPSALDIDAALATLQRATRRADGQVSRHASDDTATVEVALPLTLAIIRALMARVGDETYAIPIEAVHESLEVNVGAIATVEGLRVVELRGEALPLAYLREVFAVQGDAPNDRCAVVVLGQKRKRMGLVVDGLLGIREVVIKPLSSRFIRNPAISGSAILGDQQIALILDADAFASLVHEAPTTPTQRRIA